MNQGTWVHLVINLGILSGTYEPHYENGKICKINGARYKTQIAAMLKLPQSYI